MRVPSLVMRELAINGTPWRFSDDASPRRALLCLPGAMGVIHAGTGTSERLSAIRRVVRLEYPDAPTLAGFCDGVVALLDALGIAKADILGSSLGGFLAQQLAIRHPDRIGDLVLVHTYVLDERGARRLEFANRLAPHIPRGLFARLAWLKINRVLKPVRRFNPESYEAVVAQARESFRASLTPTSVRRNNDWMIEAVRSGRSRVPAAAGRRVSIIESDNDPSIRAGDRAALRAAYPAARVKTFSGTGHVTPLAMPLEYAAVVSGFLADAE